MSEVRWICNQILKQHDYCVMNANRKLAKTLFASTLRDAIVGVFGHGLSASKFADAFNLRAHGTSTISRETARKWIRGDAMPEIGKLRVLVQWLNLDPSSFLQSLPQEENTTATYVVAYSADETSNVRKTLIGILPQLDENSLEVLYLTAVAMKTLKKTKSEAGVIDPLNLRFVLN